MSLHSVISLTSVHVQNKILWVECPERVRTCPPRPATHMPPLHGVLTHRSTEAMDCDCAEDSWTWLYAMLVILIPKPMGAIVLCTYE
jgi:hypothetical protein